MRATILLRLALATALAAALPPLAVAAADAPLHRDLREEVLHVQVKVGSAFGEVEGRLPVTLFRPAGDGPFPLVVISHGRDSDKRAAYERPRFESAARFFVRKGFAVAVPLRLGYGELAELGDPEASGGCRNPRYAPALAAAAAQIATVAGELAKRPDIDRERLVLVGQSVGGMATVAATALRSPGLVAAINFAGGHGGNPENHPGDPCVADQLKALVNQYGQLNAAQAPAVPMLWVYAENDRYFAPRHSRRWAQVYGAAGAPLEFELLPPFADDGHKLFARGADVWQPLVDAYLIKLGFTRSGRIARPPDSGFAALADEGALPLKGGSVVEGYRKFLAAESPRAFAVGAKRWGYAHGDDAMSRALGLCQRDTGQACQLYAVDDRIVWSPQ